MDRRLSRQVRPHCAGGGAATVWPPGGAGSPKSQIVRRVSNGILHRQQPVVGGLDASLRTAVIRTLVETAPSRRASKATRHALTVALVNPGRGLLVKPRAEFVEPQIVDSLRDRGGDPVERLELVALVLLLNYN